MEPGAAQHRDSIRRLRRGERIPDGTPRRYVTNDGYRLLRWKVGPYTYVEVLEHRVVDGRATTAEHVHHVNGDRLDNRPANLEHIDETEHVAIHREQKQIDYDEAWRLYDSGLSTIEVGERLGCNPATISRGLRKAGHTLRDPGTGRRIDLDPDRIVNLYLSGMRPRRIGALYGVSDSPIRRILNDAGIPPYRPGRPV